jgi:hypothetical protein
VACLHLGHRPPDGAPRAVEAERPELLETDVGADLCVGPLDPLLDLGQERIDDPLPAFGPSSGNSMISSRDFTRSSWSTVTVQRPAVDREEHPPGHPGERGHIHEDRSVVRHWAVLLAASG